MVTLFYCIFAYLYIVNSQPSNYVVSFNELVVGDYVIIEGESGGYLRDSEDGTTLISSSTFDDTATWEVTNDWSGSGIEFKNTKTGNYIKGDGSNCFVGSLGGSGNWGTWEQAVSGTFDNDQHGKCCCVNSADDNTITHGSCANSCSQFVFHVIRVPSLRTITSFNSLVVGNNVIIESGSGFGGYLTDNEDGSTLITKSSFDINSAQIWEVTNDFSSAGIEFKNRKTGYYIKGDGSNCFVGSLGGSGNWGGWRQATSGTFDNDQHGKCCCIDSVGDTTITHGSCGNSCSQFVFHVISDISSLCSSVSSPVYTYNKNYNYYDDNLKLMVEVSSLTCFIILSVMVTLISCIYCWKGKFNTKQYKYNTIVNTDSEKQQMT